MWYLTEPEREQHEADLPRLIDLGMIELDLDGQPLWTRAAFDAVHKTQGQTWS